MREVLRTNDPVLLSLVETLLADAGITALTADASMSVLEGSLGVLPRRVLVAPADEHEASRLIAAIAAGSPAGAEDANPTDSEESGR